MLKKRLNFISKKINSIEFYDSITVINIAKKNLSQSKNLENNKKLRNFFDDYRYKRILSSEIKSGDKKFSNFLKKKISKRSYLYRIYENSIIMKYFKLIKN